ncbi:unnamed protein product [Rhizoctonia solani]|uniref:Uncharacterized protein n=1 Tax=Rhizoctonia solani TaxID=456999 RepID=A0A8H3A321_9AGAM|nr:unnamed protein product [Rhizoctonia solani]
MDRFRARVIWGILTIATWTEVALGYSYKVNVTLYDTNSAHVTYSDVPIACRRWVNSWLFWKGKVATLHSSLNHQNSSVNIEFKGSDVWVYGPPLSQLAKLPPDYKICLYEKYNFSTKPDCYQSNITAAYYANKDEDRPVVVFARGGLQHHQHRIEISIADPVDDLQDYDGIKFSHVLYTTERPTPWPIEEDGWRYREVVMDDTHPLFSYSPPTTSDPLAATPAWLARVHTADDGTVMSWHELRSHNEGDQDEWRVGSKIKAGAVAIYGAPNAYVERNRYDLGFVCVRLDLGLCEVVDLKTIYANNQQKYYARPEPVLLWYSDALDPSRETLVSIHQVKGPTGTGTVFPFKSMNYFEQKEYTNSGLRVGKSENVTVTNDDRSISYNPPQSCDESARKCDPWGSPWIQRKVGPLGTKLSFRSTIWNHRDEMDPHVTMSFKGSALYLYGAPNAYAARPFAPQHVCINDVCRVIDVEQAYLHPPSDVESTGANVAHGHSTIQGDATSVSIPHPELEPVLIWSITGLDDENLHTFRLALASVPAPLNAEMTFVKISYTRVTYRYGEGRPDPPSPKPDRAYMGPLQPPYATNWTPFDHKPPPPFSINPPPDQGYISRLLLGIVALFVAYVCLSLALRFWGRRGDETQPLLPGPAPSYSPTEYSAQPSGPNNARKWLNGRPPNPLPNTLNATDTLPGYSPTTSARSNERR